MRGKDGGGANAEAKLTNDDYSDTTQCSNSEPEYLPFDQLNWQLLDTL
jgi:hypothetical protein